MLKGWFEEVSRVTKVFKNGDSEFIIYKGFKLTFSPKKYIIEDVRFTDFYTEVSEEDLEILKSKGFVLGARTIMYHRDCKRVKNYEKRIAKLYEDRDRFKKNLSKDRVFNSKRVRNCNENIHNFLDLMFFYKTRVEQFSKN